ncbi:MAG TPA: Gfo/Idh/MocA family oxidoreductase [Anaerolineaceae bacterium]|nr:Gfo/Idh/MocA family oxidoreductase [Anaerolineaceae bacterium]
MKFMIAGYGSIGRRHMRNLLALGEQDILLYRSKRSTLPEDELAGFQVETNLEAALDQSPQAVIVSNPTALHLDVAIPAAERGCHILLEKPVSNNLERLPELKDALRVGGGRLLVGFQFRFHPCIRQAAALLKEGAIGKPLSAQAHYGDYMPGWHPWEDYRKSYSARDELGGGVALTLCHPLDYLRWLLGEISSVWGYTGQVSEMEINVEDEAEIGLKFVNGTVGSAHLDYYQRPPTHRFEIIGMQGTLRWDNDDNILRVFRAGTGVWEEIPAPANFERNDMFLDEMRHFLAVARGEAEPVCSLADGERVLQIALAARQSSRSGLRVDLS